MPPLETDDLVHKAVLWGRAGTDRYGRPKVGAPEELDVRWNWRRTEATDQAGNEVALDADVAVDRRIAPGSKMWRGELADWYGTGSAGDDSELMEVVTYQEVDDVKGRETRRTVGLKRYEDKLPGEV
jgi:hypothetical protein